MIIIDRTKTPQMNIDCKVVLVIFPLFLIKAANNKKILKNKIIYLEISKYEVLFVAIIRLSVAYTTNNITIYDHQFLCFFEE